MKKYLFLLFLLPLCSFKPGTSVKSNHLKPYFHHEVRMDEPSDICLSTIDPTHFFVVGDRGSIAELDADGKVLRRTQGNGSDYEGICMKDNVIYVVDESSRRIDFVNPADLKITKSIYLHYSGARNNAFEGITYIPSLKKYILIIERQPTLVFELNEQFQLLAEVKTKQFKELSSVTYHDGYLYFLSDELHEIMKCDINDYHIIDRWKLPVVNPEGITFDNEGNVVVVSDDLAELFKFKI